MGLGEYLDRVKAAHHGGHTLLLHLPVPMVDFGLAEVTAEATN
jgi:hypothetical protein